MIAGTLDVLLVSRTEMTETAELEAAGLRVERADSLVAAMLRLQAGAASIVLAGGDLCSGREEDAFAAMREAGARALLAVYPPQHAWRAARALAVGADDTVVLPAAPGAVLLQVLRLLRAAPAVAGTIAAPPALLTAPVVAAPVVSATVVTATDVAATNVPATVVAVTVHAATGVTAPEPLADESLSCLVGDIAQINRSVGELDRLFELVVSLFARRGGAARCSLMLLDEAQTGLHVKKSLGLPDREPRAPVPLGKGLAGRVAKTGLPLLIADIDRMRGERAPGETAGAYRTRSCLLLPLRATRGVLGVVCLSDKESGEPFDEGDLARLRFLSDQTAQALENALAFRQMQDLAAIDELTGLSNRRQFQMSIELEVQRARRYGRSLTLAIFDVDFFKNYNDAHGHPAGDRALSTIGAILRNSFREVDIVARYGGEEFAVILPETAARSGAGLSPFPFLERLRRRVAATGFPGGQLTISGGIASFPDDAESVEDLVHEADRALYVSKARGRNTITYRGAPVVE